MKRVIIKTIKEAQDFFKEFNKSKFSFDTETTSLSYYNLEIVGCSFCDGCSACYIVINDTNRRFIMDYLGTNVFNAINNGKGIRIICHNIVYDMKVLHKYGINLEKAGWYDTMIAYHLIDENLESKRLKFLTREILGKEVVEFSQVNTNYYSEQFYQYGIDDAVNTWELFIDSLPKLVDKELTKLFFKIEMPFQRVLLEMEITGVTIDKDKVKSITKLLEEDSIKIEKELHDMLGVSYSVITDIYGNKVGLSSSLNLNSSQQLSKIIFEDLGLEPIEYTKSGKPSTGKMTLSAYSNNSFIKGLKLFKGAKKLLNAFMKPLPTFIDGDGKVRPSFHDCGARTGRLSCSKPNLQQLPSPGKADYDRVNVRECFTVPQGYKMFSADYSGQEIAVMAQVSKDPTLVKSLNNGFDMHLAIANQFYNLGIPEECLSKTHKDYSMWKEKFYNERSRAKTITFGLAYGKQAYGFAKDFGISEDEAQKIVDDYFEGMPKLKEAIDDAHSQIDKYGYVRSMAGRYRHFTKVEKYGKEEYPSGAYRQSFNFLIQGFSADMIRVAAVNIWNRKRQHPEWDLKFIMTVHDELNFQVKEEYVEVAGAFVKEVMETACNFVVPTKADIEIGDNYGNSK